MTGQQTQLYIMALLMPLVVFLMVVAVGTVTGWLDRREERRKARTAGR